MRLALAQAVGDQHVQIVNSIAIRKPVLGDKVAVTSIDFWFNIFRNQVIGHLDSLELLRVMQREHLEVPLLVVTLHVPQHFPQLRPLFLLVLVQILIL